MNKNTLSIVLFVCMTSSTLFTMDWNAELASGLQEKNREKVKKALVHNADPNLIIPANKETVLHYAARYDWDEVIITALNRAATITLRNSMQETPLHIAVHALNKNAVNLLLERGAEVDALDFYNHTPLQTIAYLDLDTTQNALFIIRCLLAHGATCSVPTIPCLSAVENAVLAHNTKELKRLLSELNITKKTNNTTIEQIQFALSIAVGQKHKKSCQQLYDYCATHEQLLPIIDTLPATITEKLLVQPIVRPSSSLFSLHFSQKSPLKRVSSSIKNLLSKNG